MTLISVSSSENVESIALEPSNDPGVMQVRTSAQNLALLSPGYSIVGLKSDDTIVPVDDADAVDQIAAENTTVIENVIDANSGIDVEATVASIEESAIENIGLTNEALELYLQSTGGEPFHIKSNTVVRLLEDIFVTSGISQFARYDESMHRALLLKSSLFVIDGENVLFDMNGHTIEINTDFMDTDQPFYTIMELSSKPFQEGVGPEVFRDIPLRSARNCVITNGTMKRASHNCIHGVGVQDIAIVNVNFEDFEVGGIGFTTAMGNILISKCTFKARTNCRRTPAASGVIESGLIRTDVPLRPEIPSGSGTKRYPLDASTVYGIQINGGFFIHHPTEGALDPSTNATLQQGPKAGFWGRCRNVTITNCLFKDIGAQYDEPLRQFYHNSDPLKHNGNIVMCRENQSNYPMWELDEPNEILAKKALQQYEEDQNITPRTDEQLLLTSLGYELYLSCDFQISKFDNRGHGMKPICSIRMRGVVGGYIANNKTENLVVAGAAASDMNEACVHNFSDCANIDGTNNTYPLGASQTPPPGTPKISITDRIIVVEQTLLQ